jgi:hypothetical protein
LNAILISKPSPTPRPNKKSRTIEQQYGMDAEQIIADQRYDFVTKIKSACETDKDMGESMTDKLDKVFLNKWAALPIFVVIMALVYFLSVGLVGSLTTDFMDALFNGSASISVFYHDVPFTIKGLGPLLGDWILSLGGSALVSGLGSKWNHRWGWGGLQLHSAAYHSLFMSLHFGNHGVHVTDFVLFGPGFQKVRPLGKILNPLHRRQRLFRPRHHVGPDRRRSQRTQDDHHADPLHPLLGQTSDYCFALFGRLPFLWLGRFLKSLSSRGCLNPY